MHILLWIVLSTLFVSVLAFIGILTLLLKENLLRKTLLFLVSLSAGVLMAGAFLHLIPEALEKFAGSSTFLYVIAGFVLFFLIEKLLFWRHCHEGRCPAHEFAYINLLGDGIHNFIDGLIIAAGFMANINLGIITTIAVALHEIPQEIGDFGVLIFGGFGRTKALFYNFISAVTAVLGGLLGYSLSGLSQSFVPLLLPIAAGGFIYIAASDLLPEIKKETDLKKSILTFVVFLIGIGLMAVLR